MAAGRSLLALQMIQLFSVNHDDVIKSAVAQGQTNYNYALTHLVPLINKFDDQRKVQRKKFYERLKLDIVRGCQMPPITLAFVDSNHAKSLDIGNLTTFINENIANGYVLDGMQRLNTLQDASSEDGFSGDRALQINVIVAERYDLLLYRMITLNNGQKPMTARHQIEMLTKGMLDTEGLNISIVWEKDTETSTPIGAFKRSDIAAAYTAFLTDSVNNQNSRIIESKLDEILVGKVMDSDITESDVSFHDVLAVVDAFSTEQDGRDWLRLGNNLIGFSVGAKRSLAFLEEMSPDEFRKATGIFEEAFEAMNVSKINVGKMRRELSKLFIEGIEKYSQSDSEDLLLAFHEETAD